MQIEILELLTADLDRVEGFYGGLLGLPVEKDSTSDRLTITAGTSLLVFRQRADFSGRYHFAFNIPENRAAAAHDFLLARNIAPVANPDGETVLHFPFWNAHAVYYYDPAGNIGEFIARHELPNAAPEGEPFSADHILNVSEIGLPSADVAGLAAQLADGVRISSYRVAAPVFMPHGDAHGLFILVPEGRPWFPDAVVPAASLPVRVQVQNESCERFQIEGPPFHIQPL